MSASNYFQERTKLCQQNILRKGKSGVLKLSKGNRLLGNSERTMGVDIFILNNNTESEKPNVV